MTTLVFFAAEGTRNPWSLPALSHSSLGVPQQLMNVRGGAEATSPGTSSAGPTLDEKVQAAMQKLGISSPTPKTAATSQDTSSEEGECKDGVCPMPDQEQASNAEHVSTSSQSTASDTKDPYDLADQMAKELQIPSFLAMAAIGATMSSDGKKVNEQAARAMIQQELDLMKNIPEDSPNVLALTKEGYDAFLSRRALALTGNQMDDARAILIADQMDEQEEQEAEAKAKAEAEKARAAQEQKQPAFKEVKTDFDPTALPATSTPSPQQASTNQNDEMPKPVAKDKVVFEATTAQIQKLVLESPVPVLLDIYADWCGPCKVLGPALEDMAMKAGGMFRLVKVNSDNERPVSAALQVSALPTVFGIRNGKIVHMFQGMPQSEDAFKNFLMGLLGAAPFNPAVTAQQSAQYEELTTNLIKVAGAAAFSFSDRERLVDFVTTQLDALAKDDNVQDIEATATLVRTLLHNVVQNPIEPKFRKIKLDNKRVASTVAGHSNALAILKAVGFSKTADGTAMNIGKDKSTLNVAPLVVARDCIDKWMQTNRREMAAAARRRQDEADRAKLELETNDEDEEEDDEEEEEVDLTACKLKLRVEGKKKVHEVTLKDSDPLSSVLDVLKIDQGEDEVQITCVAKRLVIKSGDKSAMAKSLKEHGLMPSAAVVVKVGTSTGGSGSDGKSSSLKERAAKQKKKRGSHTMQSIGIYSSEDNAKGNLVDGGGGVWYEQDVSDDEEAKDETDDKKVDDKTNEEDDASNESDADGNTAEEETDE